jgi:hypothetical protein
VVEVDVRQLGAVVSGLAGRRMVFSVREVRRFTQSWWRAACGIVGLDSESEVQLMVRMSGSREVG